MAQQVGNGFTINLTASVRAGTKALEELHSQGHISTTNWYHLDVSPIDNHNINSGADRTLTFTLEDNRRVEVKVRTWKWNPSDVAWGEAELKWAPCYSHVDEDTGISTEVRIWEPSFGCVERKWFPSVVYVETDGKMLAFNNRMSPGKCPWTRIPEFDKLVPSAE